MFTQSRADSRSLINKFTCPHKINPLALSTGHFNVTLTTICFGLSSSFEHIFCSTRSVYITCFYNETPRAFFRQSLMSTESDPLCPCEMLLNTQYSQEAEQIYVFFESSFIPYFVLQISILSFEFRTKFFKQNLYSPQPPHPKVLRPHAVL